MTPLESHGATDDGRKRDHNEDAFAIDDASALYVLCDGMGGHASGEVASEIAVTELIQFYSEICRADDFEWPWPHASEDADFENRALHSAILHANERIYVESMKDAKLEGMGTTICAIAKKGDRMVLGWVGDSRIYRVRGNQIRQLSEDHSLINHYRRLGKTEEELAQLEGRKNVIVRALGLKDRVEVDLLETDVLPDDILLMCSDGLTDLVEDWVIEGVITSWEGGIEGVATTLIRLANERGGKDNITVLLVRVPIDDEATEDPSDEEEGAPETGRSTRPIRKTSPIDVVVSVGETSLSSEPEPAMEKTGRIAPSTVGAPPPRPPTATPADAPLNLIPPAEEDPLNSAQGVEKSIAPARAPSVSSVSQWTENAELRVIYDEARPAPLPGEDD